MLTLLSCHHYEKKAGIGFNDTRKKIGLPPLKRDWRLVNEMHDILLWSNPKSKNQNSFVTKLVEVSDGKVVREENLISGDKKFQTVDGTFTEELYISCRMKDEKLVEWNCVYEGPMFEFRKAVTKNEADSILKEWGLYNDVYGL